MDIFGFIAKPLAQILFWIYNLVHNYGLTIILFTLLVRFCLFPLVANQTKHSVRMQEFQPKLQALQKKYANDKQELQRQQMELYKEENFNPAMGCLPMVIQMPILMGLYVLLRDPNAYLTGSHTDMILAVHEGFFWIPDLSQPDLWILPIAAGITTFISFSFTQQQTTPGAENQMAGMMKIMKVVFPIMIVWMARSFPSGLALYWFMGNIATIIQFFILKQVRKMYVKRGIPEKKKRKSTPRTDVEAPTL